MIELLKTGESERVKFKAMVVAEGALVFIPLLLVVLVVASN
jgi:hypothetical protein